MVQRGGGGGRSVSLGTKKRKVLLFLRGTTYVECSVSDHTKSNYYPIPFYKIPKYSVK